jgi:hypothetical protein
MERSEAAKPYELRCSEEGAARNCRKDGKREGGGAQRRRIRQAGVLNRRGGGGVGSGGALRLYLTPVQQES